MDNYIQNVMDEITGKLESEFSLMDATVIFTEASANLRNEGFERSGDVCLYKEKTISKDDYALRFTLEVESVIKRMFEFNSNPRI